jgi:hypothetical protein
MKQETPSQDAIRQTWSAMRKFCNDESLEPWEWAALSWLTLIDRNRLEFAPGNCRWAASDAERADNLLFYRSLGASCRSASMQ